MENKYVKLVKTYWKALLAFLFILFFVGYFLFGSIFDWWDNRQVLNELKAKDKEIEKLKVKANQNEAEIESFKQQSEEFKNEATKAIGEKEELENKVKQLQEDIQPIQIELEKVRKGNVKHVGSLNERVIDFSARLNKLYPNN